MVDLIMVALAAILYVMGWMLTKTIGDIMGFWFNDWTSFLFWYIMLVILSGIAVKRAFSQESKDEFIDG